MKWLAIIVLLCLPCSAVTIYVSQSGGSVSCGADGTQSTTAVGSVTYSAGNTYKYCGTITSTVTMNSSGTAGNEIILDGSDGTFNASISLTGASYWFIQNVTWATTFQSSSAAISMEGTDTNGTIQNNTIDIANPAGTDSNSARMIWLGPGTHDIIIKNNFLRNAATTNPLQVDIMDTSGSYNVTVQGNYFETRVQDDATCGATQNCHNDQIQTWGTTYNWSVGYNEFVMNCTSCTNNRSYMMLQGSGTGYFDVYSNVFVGIHGASSANGISWNCNTGTDCHLYGNTFLSKTDGPNNVVAIAQLGGTVTISNNIIEVTNTSAYNSSGTITRSNNLWFNAGTGNIPTCNGTELCGSDPLFSNITTNDLTLQSGSPARSFGANLGTSYNQYPLASAAWPNPALGTRPASGAWDAGAYQYVGIGSGHAYINVAAGRITVAAGRITVNPPSGPVQLGYTGTDVVQWPATIPNVGGATKVTTAVYDTSFSSPAPIYRCTDSLTIPNPGSNSSVTGGIGGSGAGIAVNLSATLLHANTGNGGDAIIMFNPSTGQCGDPTTGRAITTDKNSAGGGSATSYADFGSGNFSLSQNMTWYSFGGAAGANATNVTPVTFTSMAAPTNINYTWGSQIADFANGLPNASNTPEWTINTSYSNGAYVKHTLTASEYWTWVTGTVVQQGDIMLLSGCAYKVTTAGTTGGTIPTGHTTCNTNSLPLDGSVKWKDLGGPAAFIYQLTSAGGTSGGSTPTFTTTCAGCVSRHADFMATVTDNTTLTWTNVGVAQNPSGIGWISWGGTSADDTKFAETVNTNSYGFSGSYTRCQGGQDCGLWLMEYDSTANKYYLFNTYTGIQSSITCTGGGGTTCGSWVTQGTITTNITSLPSNGFCQFGLHNEKINRDGNYAIVTQQGNQFAGTCTALNFYVWRPLQTFSATTQLLVFAHGLNHWTTGQNYVAALNDSGYTSPSGVFMTYTPLNNPAATGAFPSCTAGAGNCPLIFWEGHPCNDTPSNEPACTLSISIDAHPSMAYNPGGTDNSPVCTTAYNYGSLSPIETYPYQGEEICIKSSTTWTDSSAPATNPAYRLTHSFNDGTNDQFNTQFGISQYSQDGHWLIFTTDWDSTLGTKDGSDPTCNNTFPCAGGFQVAPLTGRNCLGGQPWQANHSYALGTVLHPIQGTGGGGTIYEVVQNVACSGTCTSAATPPAWNTTDPVGTTYTDNTGANQITWKVLSLTGNCRGDLFAVKTAN